MIHIVLPDSCRYTALLHTQQILRYNNLNSHRAVCTWTHQRGWSWSSWVLKNLMENKLQKFSEETETKSHSPVSFQSERQSSLKNQNRGTNVYFWWFSVNVIAHVKSNYHVKADQAKLHSSRNSWPPTHKHIQLNNKKPTGTLLSWDNQVDTQSDRQADRQTEVCSGQFFCTCLQLPLSVFVWKGW